MAPYAYIKSFHLEIKNMKSSLLHPEDIMLLNIWVNFSLVQFIFSFYVVNLEAMISERIYKYECMYENIFLSVE